MYLCITTACTNKEIFLYINTFFFLIQKNIPSIEKCINNSKHHSPYSLSIDENFKYKYTYPWVHAPLGPVRKARRARQFVAARAARARCCPCAAMKRWTSSDWRARNEVMTCRCKYDKFISQWCCYKKIKQSYNSSKHKPEIVLWNTFVLVHGLVN